MVLRAARAGLDSPGAFRDHPRPLSVPELLRALSDLALTALVGRVLLSLLPAGEPGRHGPSELLATWAASHLLGVAAIALQLELLALLQVEAGFATLFLPWLLPAVLRVATLPGAMVPRHAARHEDAGRGAQLLRLATALVVAWTFASAGSAREPFGALVGPASYAAMLALLAHALRATRRAPFGRALFVLALAATPPLSEAARGSPTLAGAALLAGGGASFAAIWLRRVDRRARAIAVLALAALATFEPSLLFASLAGLVALVLATPRPIARSTAAWSGLAWALAASPTLLGGAALDGAPGLRAPRLVPWTSVHSWVLVLVAGVALKAITRDGARGEIDPPGRELAFALCFFALAALAVDLVVVPSATGATAPTAAARAALLVPLLALSAGMLCVPAERPDGR